MTGKAVTCYGFSASICRSRGFCGKVSRRELNCCQNNGGEGEGVRYADKPCGLSAHARTAVFAIGRAKTVTERGIYPRETNRTQSRRRTLGFPSPHDFYQLPQPLAKKICFAKIFCEEEERAFSAYCPALPNSRVVRSVPTTSVRKETCEPLYTVSQMIWSLVNTQISEAILSDFLAISSAEKSVFCASARAAASA